jgi:uncharacterized membrane protein SpoIIM required for sporulation
MKKIALVLLHGVITIIALFISWTIGGLLGMFIAEMPQPEHDRSTSDRRDGDGLNSSPY